MTDHAQPPARIPEGGAVAPPHPGAVGPPWPDDDLGGEDDGGQAAKRILAALRRYRGLVAISALLGIGAGYVAYQMGEPEYEVQGSFWMTQPARGDLAGPLAQGVLLSPRAFTDLMRTGAVLGPVIISQRLYLQNEAADDTVLETFRVDERYAPGRYTLVVSDDGRTWTLRTEEGLQVDQGRVGEAVGTRLGMLWTPERSELTPEREIDFTVLNTQDAARALRERIVASPTQDGNFINFTLAGRDPVRIASILTSVMEQLRSVATDLKTAQLDSAIAELEKQYQSTQVDLDQARTALEQFKISTATLPMDDGGAPVAAGLQQTQNTVYGDYFQRRLQQEQIRAEIEQLQEALARIPEEGVPVEALEVVPAVQSSTELQEALTALVRARMELRVLLQDYTDEYLPVRELRDNIAQMEKRDVPSLVRGLIGRLQSQEQQLATVMASREQELTRIPPRTIREATLQQDVASRQMLSDNVLRRLDENRLARRSTQPDLQVIDTPEVPQVPARDERITWFGMAFLAALGLGVGAAVVLDRFDPRLRYPMEVSRAMGLEVLGAVPRIRGRRRQNAGQVLEAFREIRMRVQYAYGSARPLVVAVTSAESGEGKTFVTANLGITFAQLGKKTLVIDADTRRGDMHDLFGLDRKPGLTDLFRRHTNGSVIQSTKHDNLHFLACGSRRADSPDMLSSGDMQELLASAKRRYEVILFDCPPLAAGSDAFILGAHAGNVLMVLRSGATHKELARAKMEAFYRLPVRLLGAVLNDIEPNASYGAYRYYSYYLPGYSAADEEEEETRVVAM